MNDSITFKINDLTRFENLQKVFYQLKQDKENRSFNVEEFYLKFFDEKAKSYFGWYSEAENKDWSEKWFSTPYEQRWTDPTLKRKWDFGSMLMSLEDGDYQLISCELISEDKAKLLFYPFGHPYGGTGCLEALIESFGFEIIEIDTA